MYFYCTERNFNVAPFTEGGEKEEDRKLKQVIKSGRAIELGWCMRSLSV